MGPQNHSVVISQVKGYMIWIYILGSWCILHHSHHCQKPTPVSASATISPDLQRWATTNCSDLGVPHTSAFTMAWEKLCPLSLPIEEENPLVGVLDHKTCAF